MKRLFLIAVYIGCAGALGAAERTGADQLPPDYRKLLPLHRDMDKPGSFDWLSHHEEPGQTYLQYVKSRPIRAVQGRRTLYVQPLGDFTAAQRRIVDKTAEFLGNYFGLPVIIREGIGVSVVPGHARRKAGLLHDEQLLTTYILSDVLKPRLPKDAVALIAITNADLWPGEGWNYVFGQASLGDRVGVWSFHRFGDPDRGEKEYQLCLLRTLKTATHETGHMFSLPHCIALRCNMNGRNHLAETDRGPLEVCPHCLAKLYYATGARPEGRFKKLRDFCKANGLKAEAEFYEKSLESLKRTR